MNDDLVLYYRPTCPYCMRVLSWLSEHGADIAKRDIGTDPAARETLCSVGGKLQVPCLFIKGRPLYESEDIIAYLSKHI